MPPSTAIEPESPSGAHEKAANFGEPTMLNDSQMFYATVYLSMIFVTRFGL